jgi:SAM-dependent methyltransferase
VSDINDQTDQTRKTRDLFEEIASDYDSHYRQPIHLAEDQATSLLLTPYLTRAEFVLDLGCGTGWLLDNFPHLKPSEYLGLDLCGSMLAAAIAKHPGHNFLQADIQHLSPDFAVKGLIVSTFGMLSHLPPETWVPILSALALPGTEYFLTLYTPRSEERPSSLARTHSHLMHIPGAYELRELLTAHGLAPRSMLGLNPWGDGPLPYHDSTEDLAQLMVVDATDTLSWFRDGVIKDHPDTRYLLGVGGRKE